MRCCGMPCHILLSDEFDGDSRSSHRCCGGTVHIKMATLFVATSALIVCAFNAVSMSFGIYSVNFEFDILLIIANAITATMIFYGLYYEKPRLLIPFIINSILQCAGFFLLAIYTLYYTVTYKKQTFNRKFDQLLLTTSIFIGIIIATWSCIVTAKCYHYLKEQNQNSEGMMKERCLWR
uniref:MARVEL domain-containing protein n=1 Tax=Onchocerca volvulus TaxID=6282 RepID=A0A2K6VRX3_ONCVO